MVWGWRDILESCLEWSKSGLALWHTNWSPESHSELLLSIARSKPGAQLSVAPRAKYKKHVLEKCMYMLVFMNLPLFSKEKPRGINRKLIKMNITAVKSIQSQVENKGLLMYLLSPALKQCILHNIIEKLKRIHSLI